jgi:hypothetical protein
LTADEVDPVNDRLPWYDAVTAYVPATKVAVVSVATPLALSVPVPRLFEPFRNVTVPVGTAVPAEATTVAVKVTLFPAPI